MWDYINYATYNELKMFRLIKIRVDEMMTDIACRIDNHKFVYDNGHIINNRDRMRLRMIIGTLHTFYTNYKHIIAIQKCLFILRYNHTH